MQETDSTYEREQSVSPAGRSLFRRLLPLYAILLLMIVTALVVPLINVNRYQRRIVVSLSESLGRPIHLDRISLTVLPLPGLTIENLVVGEDPAFGSEPFIRASSVRATLRISSLWRRRIEFTTISFTEPSINLVKTTQGKWNLESILLQASRIAAAPTAQARASAAPRFPYIEATGARLNLKADQEKMPISLTDADFALWLDSPEQWRLRLNGHPNRTDTNASDTGTLQIEGTLGHASTLKDVPVNLKAEWRNAPLGEASRVLLGHDAGLRGSLTLSTTTQGTVGKSTVQTMLHLSEVRRADFIPERKLSIDVECQAVETEAFRSLNDLQCSWPPALTSEKKILALTGSIPDLRQLSSASFELGTPGIPASTLLEWMRVASSQMNPEIVATGSLTGSLFFHGSPLPSAAPGEPWEGQFAFSDGSLTVPSVTSAKPMFSGSVALHSTPPATSHAKSPQPVQLVLPQVPLDLGGRDLATIDGRFDENGYTLHLTGTALPAKLLALGAALPQIGNGLAAVVPPAASTIPFRFDLTSTRMWGGQQVWHPTDHVTASSKYKKPR
ncbi:AsmA family protein [Granulicella arctica]|uniref:AsmA protein n=1 Tax=Granulicella arctica TaxID=940613 RepID=A0A7Y9PE55_9BACT|nr:AsmA family protein [Granulicella arctica]NYF78014.1 AsmA protein [Granulicella arctica]